MGDLAADTAIDALGGGRYRATLSTDWEIWGPMGGYIGAIAMRAVGAEASLTRPASYFCHYLTGARFGQIELQVTPIRRGRSAESLRVLVTQDDRAVIDATVCVIADNEGLEHEVTACPEVPDPAALQSLAEYFAEDGVAQPQTPFWANFDARPEHPRGDGSPPRPRDPEWRQWHRFVPRSTFEDPWLDAARYVLLCDLPSWPAAVAHHGWQWGDQPSPWTAPTLDLYVAFHRQVPAEPWLLVDGRAPIAADGLLGWNVRIWSLASQLVASGSGQALFRRAGPAP